MLFNSLTFIIFLCITVALYYLLPQKATSFMLFIASCIFYMWWEPIFIVLILFVTLVSYISARLMDKYPARKKATLIISLILSFSLLFIFKYAVFFNDTLIWLCGRLSLKAPKHFDILLPMGISFFTFQAVSYVIDVYRNEYKSEKSFLKLALFVMFFPQLVAGPIERADRLLSQLSVKHKFHAKNFSLGIKLMLMGYFKKVVISDRAAMLVDTVYNSAHNFTGLSLIIATLLFAVQIYCDFGGYTDIARGCAKLLGIDLMQNFDRPYFAFSIKDFWRRWHISLSTWFRDYLYIPMGGSRCSTARKYFNLFVTFAVSGLWHGANWTFVIWGTLHGIYQIIGDLKNKLLQKLGLSEVQKLFKPFAILITFVLVVFAWIFFRANTVSDAFYIIQNLKFELSKQYLYETLLSLGIGLYDQLMLLIAIAWLFMTDAISFKYDIHTLLSKTIFPVRFVYYYILAAFILLAGVFSGGGQFIYFQF